MIIILAEQNAPPWVKEKLHLLKIGETFKDIPSAINRLEGLGFDGCDITCCQFIPVKD
jgi:hypothetical protein